MKRCYVLIALMITLILTGCSSIPLAQQNYQTDGTALPPINATTPTPEPTEIPTSTLAPTLTPISSDDVEEDEYIQMHFDVLNIDLPVPEWTADWEHRNIQQETGILNYENGSYDNETYENIYLTAFMPDDGIDVMTGEPYVYNEYFFDDCDPGNIVDWSDDDDFFRIHALVDGRHTYICVNHKIHYNILCKLSCMDKYREKYDAAFDHISVAMKEVKPDPQIISEEDIVEYCREKYQSPLAEVDHYEDGYFLVVHLYENVEDGNESHTATWGWVKVNPITGEATDEMTYETFTVPGAKLQFE